MSAKQKLKSALSAIEDAKRALGRAEDDVSDNTEIRRAMRELDDAESKIKRAIREVED